VKKCNWALRIRVQERDRLFPGGSSSRAFYSMFPFEVARRDQWCCPLVLSSVQRLRFPQPRFSFALDALVAFKSVGKSSSLFFRSPLGFLVAPGWTFADNSGRQAPLFLPLVPSINHRPGLWRWVVGLKTQFSTDVTPSDPSVSYGDFAGFISEKVRLSSLSLRSAGCIEFVSK